MNGGRPVSSSYMRQPVEYRSDRASTRSPRACSGERYCAVPITCAVCVIVAWVSLIDLAMPKSMTLMSPFTMPAWWLYSRALSVPEMISRVRSGSSRWPSMSRSLTVLPSTNSITMNGMGTPVDMSSPVSYTATIDGLFSDAAEPRLAGLVPCEVRAQGLDRDDPVEPEVAGTVDLRHAAPPNDAIKLVAVTERHPRLCHVSHSSKPPCIESVIPARPRWLLPVSPTWSGTQGCLLYTSPSPRD